MRISLAGVTKGYGAHTVLSNAALTVGPRSRLGVVGPNGVGKSTLLGLLAGIEQPDAGSISRDPVSLSVGYLPQLRAPREQETLRGLLERRTGIAAAERDLEAAAGDLAAGSIDGADRYDGALARLLAVGGGDFDARAGTVLGELKLDVGLERPATELSGGQLAKASLASILLARHDVLLLDEPTNDLDFDGLERLERFLETTDAALVIVSHDRELLDRIVTRVVEIDAGSRRLTEYAGGWSDYATRRDAARLAAYTELEQAQRRRRELTDLLSRRRTEARSQGAGLGGRSGGSDRRGTNALRTKVRQADRQLERNELPEKPFEPWELRLTLRSGARQGDTVLALHAAVASRGSFTLGPVDVALAPGERLSVRGPNGSGKSTLLAMLDGTLPLAGGSRVAGRSTRLGVLGQGRTGFDGESPLLEAFAARTGLQSVDARTLLAKFGLGADDVLRACRTLSPGERTRAHLAALQALEVDTLILDEPTNHLDLEAVEQLETALSGFEGSLVVVTHDRRFLQALGPTREIRLPLE